MTKELPPFPKPRWYESLRRWEMHLLAWKKGVVAERKRITKWIEANRTAIVIDEGEDLIMYRDHFTSQDLLDFINSVEIKR